MIVAVIDNGSLEPAAHRHLRAVAAALSQRTGTLVHAVSWKHSDRIAPAALDGTPAWTLSAFVRGMHALGQREFVFIPFFISAQGAIGTALGADLQKLQAELSGFEFAFTAGLAPHDVLATILAARIRERTAAAKLRQPAVIVVDHGGPSPVSATLRDRMGTQLRTLLAGEIGSLAAVSMEGEHPPLLDAQLRAPELRARELVIALLFLSPGRHAGPNGDVAQICARSGTRFHLTDLVGTHPLVVETLAASLRDALAPVHPDALLPIGS